MTSHILETFPTDQGVERLQGDIFGSVHKQSDPHCGPHHLLCLQPTSQHLRCFLLLWGPSPDNGRAHSCLLLQGIVANGGS